MRAPFLLLIAVYSIAIMGMVLIPGIDDQGNVWRMSIFHAFYFVSFTATTIGFGEIPYALTDSQRLWALVIVYSSVIAWFYALGTVITLIRDKTFREVLARSRFNTTVKSIHRPFYLVCGLGETGKAVVKALTEEHFRVVVVEINPRNLHELDLNELLEFVPGIAGDASVPDTLELAGIRHPMCKGVIAVTASDEINLKIAITSKLLHPDIPVACRSEFKDVEDNMLSFGTDYIVNPYETFADIFSLVMLSPSHHLIYDWLTGAPNTKLTDPIYFKHGPWILCGYGRFGVRLYKHLSDKNIPTTIIDPVGALKLKFDNNNQGNLFIIGTGTDAETQKKAGIESAAGLIAGSDNDSNNLSIIMTARELNPDIFVVARQNIWTNQILYSSTNASLIMHPREIIARKIRAFFLTPLLINFVELLKQRDTEWANITISRLSAVVGESRPHVWTVDINKESAPAVVDCLNHGRSINIGHLTQDPGDRKSLLACVPLLLVRDNEKILMPENKYEIHSGDQILFCGTPDVKNNMRWTLKVMRSLNYVMTFTAEPESLIWRIIYRLRHKSERREKPRKRRS
jgi:Trk K+ transport system NAD-binding subunit